MSVKTYRKIGLFGALVMIIGSVVGIGIFFKNGSIAKETGANGIAWLMAWVVGGIISLFTALSFTEIGWLKNTKMTGLSNFAYKSGGSKFGYFVSLTHILFYFGILSPVLGVFGAEAIFFFLFSTGAMKSMPPVWAITLLGMFIFSLFVALNVFSIKGSVIVSSISTALKFVPLILAISLGIALAHTADGKVAPGTDLEDINRFSNPGSNFDFSKLIAALPAVLFAYDSFLIAASLGKKVKNPKVVPYATGIGMIIVIVLYTLIAIATILHGQGVIWNLLAVSWRNGDSQIWIIIVSLFIMFSVFGVINGISSAMVSELQIQIQLGTIIGIRAMRKKIGDTKTLFVYVAIIHFVWALPSLLPAIIYNSDVLIDGISNLPTIAFFGIYAGIIVAYLLNRDRNKKLKSNNFSINKYVYYFIAITSIVLIAIVEAYVLYAYFNNGINTPFEESNWGVFADNWKTSKLTELIYYVVGMIIFFTIPLINHYLVKWFESRDSLKDFVLINESHREDEPILENKLDSKKQEEKITLN